MVVENGIDRAYWQTVLTDVEMYMDRIFFDNYKIKFAME